jgi:hypothetical protein
MYLNSLTDQQCLNLCCIPARPGHPPHTLQGAEQVSGGGAGGSDSPDDGLKPVQERTSCLSIDFQGTQGYRISTSYPDGRSAPYFQFYDG